MTIIGELMSHERLVTVGPGLSTRDAVRKCIDEGVSHLLVIEGGGLIGLCCICDLDGSELRHTVSDCMSTKLVSVRADTGAQEAAELMQTRGVSCLPVLGEGVLQGVITLNDLRAAGIVDSLLSRCSACGGDDHVRCTGHGRCVGLCLECMRKSEPPGADEDIGGSG